MATFETAYDNLILLEGGYSNNSHDAGGETFAGITRTFNPIWPGWPIIDLTKPQHPNIVDLNKTLFANPTIVQYLKNFYEQQYWNFDSIASQKVADKLFAMEVNFGKGTAVRILQQALAKLGHNIVQDGSLGPKTLALVSTTEEDKMLQYLRAYSVLYRFHRVQAKPDQAVFLEGWLIRDSL